MSGNRILCTGASGFMGRCLTVALCARGDAVVGLVRDDVREHRDLALDVAVHGDLSSIAFLERVLAEYEIDTVIHLAAQTQVSVAAADPTGTLEANVRGTWNVLEACRRQKVGRVLIASSDKCYANGPTPYHEHQPVAASEAYGTSKACADLIAQTYLRQYGMPVAIVRCGNLYGPGHTNWSTLIPGTIRSVLQGERPILRSDGTAKRDYLYVADAVRGYLALVDSKETSAFNFGCERPVSVLEVVRLILHLMDSTLEPDIRSTARGEIQEQWLSSAKAHLLLGWQPEWTLERGLVETIAWHKGRAN